MSKALSEHKKAGGKLEVAVRVPLRGRGDMSVYYTPGVAEPCLEIARKPEMAYTYTGRGRTIAVVSDGSATLGLGDIGGLASMPVMEGKAVLFKKFGGIDAIPICLSCNTTEEIVQAVKAIAPSFGGINLEDIKAPKCFEVEERLIRELDIPVFHDDQHGTAIVCLAAMINALKVVGKKAAGVRVVISGAGAAGIAIARLFKKYGFKDLILVDSKGIVAKGQNKYKDEFARSDVKGGLREALNGADIFIGVSKPRIATSGMIKSMADKAIVFAMSNPDPEISVADAKAGGAKVIATGRSDFPNQVNNVLVFPGIFKGALEARARHITDKMKLAAAEALAALVKKPTAAKIIPAVFEKGVAEAVAKAVKKNI